LNSKVVRENGTLKEKVWKVGGMYSPAIEKIVYWLEKASAVAENETQKAALDKLIEYYKTGDLETWDEYNILWVQDTSSRIDVVNGSVEVYNDPLGHKGAYQSLVSIKDMEATKRIDAIGNQAQWFEDNSPIMDEHKKKNVVGISAKVITVVTGSGDVSPSSPIGVNLPNSTWIRKDHGSKSVSLGNISESYDKASSTGVLDEFCYSDEEIRLAKEHGTLAGNLHTDLHEVIGHASGQINSGVGTPKQTLKNYASAIEEARADLVALYYIMDQKMVDIGVMSTLDVAKAEYNSYLRNGLMIQLRRILPGDNIEESHMRNRQAISKWVYEKGMAENVIEKKTRDGKTYFVINDYQKLRNLFGQLLREIQRITSEGDYEAAKNFIETYGVKVDSELHKEVLARYEKLNVAPYRGFINPKLVPVYEDGKIKDVKIEYPDDFTEQMMEYGKKYSFLPVNN
jgi:dipeptidyl-peptidase-3